MFLTELGRAKNSLGNLLHCRGMTVLRADAFSRNWGKCTFSRVTWTCCPGHWVGPAACVVTSFLRTGELRLCAKQLAYRGRTKGKWLLGDMGPGSLGAMTPVGLGSPGSQRRTATGSDHMVVGDRVWARGGSSLLTSVGFPASTGPLTS